MTTRIKPRLRDLQPHDLQEAKAAAARLRQHLEASSIRIGHAAALEAISVTLGVRDWNTLSAQLRDGADADAVTSPSFQDKQDLTEDDVTRKRTKFIDHLTQADPEHMVEMIMSLSGQSGPGEDMWRARVRSMLDAAIHPLCELRDAGKMKLDSRAIREFLYLGKGFDRNLLGDIPPLSPKDVPDKAWEDLRTQRGMIQLYLRALAGEFSIESATRLKRFFDTLPGFSLEAAIQGEFQSAKACEQHGYISMSISKPLDKMIDVT